MQIRYAIPENSIFHDHILEKSNNGVYFLGIILPLGHPLHPFMDEEFPLEEDYNETLILPEGVKVSAVIDGLEYTMMLERLIDQGNKPIGLEVLPEIWDDHLIIVLDLHKYAGVKKSSVMQLVKSVSWQLASAFEFDFFNPDIDRDLDFEM